jgi:hypothetical protein
VLLTESRRIFEEIGGSLRRVRHADASHIVTINRHMTAGG